MTCNMNHGHAAHEAQHAACNMRQITSTTNHDAAPDVHHAPCMHHIQSNMQRAVHSACCALVCMLCTFARLCACCSCCALVSMSGVLRACENAAQMLHKRCAHAVHMLRTLHVRAHWHVVCAACLCTCCSCCMLICAHDMHAACLCIQCMLCMLHTVHAMHAAYSTCYACCTFERMLHMLHERAHAVYVCCMHVCAHAARAACL